MRILLVRLLVADLIATLAFFGLTRLVDQTGQITHGAGVVFYSGSAREADARIDKGIALLEAGKVDRLVMVGGHRPQEGIVGSQDMALVAIRRSGYGGRISVDIWKRAHYEAAAWVFYILPEGWRDNIIDRLRGDDSQN